MSKIAVIGDKTSILGFRALGLDAYPVLEPKEAKEIWSEIKEKNYTIIMATEEAYHELEDLVGEFSNDFTPVVLIIPPAKGGTKLGYRRIKKIIEKAIGIDIFSEEGKS